MSAGHRWLVGAVALVGVLVWAQPGEAQDPSGCLPGSGLKAIPGLVPFQTSLDAEATSASLFGAVNTLERRVLPMMGETSRRDPWAVYMGPTSLFGAVEVPIVARNRCLGLPGDSEALGLGVAPLDLHAFNLALAYRVNEWWTLLYSSSAVTSQLAPTGGDRFIGAGLTFLSGAFATLSAPLILSLGVDQFEDNFTRTTFDYVAAVAFTWEDVGELHLGYVGSEGIYTNINQRNLFIFGRAVVNEGFERIPLLEAGFNAIPLFDTSHSLFGRRLEYAAPNPQTEEDPTPDEENDNRFDFTTLNYEGLDMFWGYADIHLALTLQPEVVVHNARVTIHEIGFNPDYDSSTAFKEPGVQYAAYVGLLETPNVPYYGVEAGKRLEAGLILSGPIDRRARAYLKLSFNDRDMLTVFPYAANSLHFNAAFEGLFE